MEIKLSEIQLSKLKIMYGTKFKKYKGLYIITTSKNSCDIICENGLIRDVSSIGKVYGEYLLINKGGIGRLANLKTGKFSKRFYDEGLAEANEYLIIDSIERKSASTTYHKVYVVDRDMNEYYIEDKNERSQHLINIVEQGNKLQIIIGDDSGNINDIVITTKGKGKIRDLISDAGKSKQTTSMFQPAAAYEYFKMPTIEQIKKQIIPIYNIIKNERVYKREDVFTAKMVYAALYELLRLLGVGDEYRSVVDYNNYNKAIYDVIQQMLDNGFSEYYSYYYKDYNKNKLVAGTVDTLKEKTGDKRVTLSEVARAISIIDSIIRIIDIKDVYYIWKNNKHTYKVVENMRKVIETHLYKCRNNEIEYRIVCGIYMALFGERDSSYFKNNNMEYELIGYKAAVDYIIIYLLDNDINLNRCKELMYSEIENKVENKIELVDMIDRIADIFIRGIENPKTYGKSNSHRSFSKWKGQRLVKEEDLIIK